VGELPVSRALSYLALIFEDRATKAGVLSSLFR
jgi:hypothetical protein